MQKNFITLLIILSFFSFLSAGPPDTLWTRTYGGSNIDKGFSVQNTYDGGFIITGETWSFGAGSADVYLIRTNANGDTLWTRTYGGVNADGGNSVQQTSDSGFIIGGYTSSFGPADKNFYLIRTDKNGDTLWTKTYGGDSVDCCNSVQCIDDSGFIFIGVTYSFSEDPCHIYLIGTDLNGDSLWTKMFGGGGPDGYYRGNSIMKISDGGFIIAGQSPEGGGGNPRIYMAKLNQEGNMVWRKNYGQSSSTSKGYSALPTNTGGFVITGEVSYYDSNKVNVFLIRTDSSGIASWIKTYGGTNDDYGRSVLQMGDGGFLVAGYSSSFSSGGVRNCYLVRTDSLGDTIWTQNYGGANHDLAYSIQQISDGGFVIAGYTSSFGPARENVYLIRLGKETGIQDEIHANNLKPNVFFISYNNNLITIRYTIPYSTSVKLEAFDIKGKLVKVITDKFMHKGSHSVNWDSKRFGAGVYFLRLSASSFANASADRNGSEVSRKVTVIE